MRYLAISLLIHGFGFLFVFSRTTFIPHAQYSVQPSAQMVEVSLQGAGEMSDVEIATSPPAPRNDSVIKNTPRYDTAVKRVVHSISGVKVKANPNYFQNPPPEYPALAKQMRQEGIVILSVDVNEEGDSVKVKIIQGSGCRLLDQAALKAVSHWKFQPGSIGNIPVASTVTVPIRFRLEE